jgi:hypothetical protein
MIGPGKYDDMCTLVRKKTKATGVIVIVFGGAKGDGFSSQADVQTLLAMPDILEHVAREIRGSSREVRPSE